MKTWLLLNTKCIVMLEIKIYPKISHNVIKYIKQENQTSFKNRKNPENRSRISFETRLIPKSGTRIMRKRG